MGVLSFRRKGTCCRHLLFPSMLICLVESVVVCLCVLLVVSDQGEHLIFVFYGLAYFTKPNSFQRVHFVAHGKISFSFFAEYYSVK